VGVLVACNFLLRVEIKHFALPGQIGNSADQLRIRFY
jgi:hypothetical protein